MIWNVVLLLGFDKVAELLIQNGADVNIVGNYNETALMKASEQGKKTLWKSKSIVFLMWLASNQS